MKKIIVLVLLVLSSGIANAERRKIDSLQKIVGDLPDTSKMSVYCSLSKEYLNISNDSIEMYASLSLALAQKYGERKTEAKDYTLLGVAEKNKGNYEKAITYQLQGLKIHEADNNEREMAVAYNDIGILYKSMNRWDEALSYYRRSNELCRKINLSGGISMTYNNIGTIMKEKAMKVPQYMDSAIAYYKLALDEAKKKGDTYNISTCLSNIGEVYTNQKKDYDTALVIFLQCLQYDKGNEDKYGMSLSYLHIGALYLLLNSPDKALRYSDSAYKIADEEKLLRQKLDVIDLQSQIKAAQHDYAGAFLLKNEYINLRDSIINEETAKQLSELQTKYETAKKERELSKKELLIQQRNYQLFGIVGGMILLSIVVFLLYNRQQIKQKQAREKAVQAAEFNERLRIAKDVHDDLGAGLSKISLIANVAEQKVEHNGNPSSDIRHIVSTSKDLIDNMRDLIWVLNPENTTLDNLLARLREYSADYLEGMDIEAALDFPDKVPEMRISRESQRNIFSTVKEAINNCVKHAAATQLNIRVSAANNKLTIYVSDNGKGFDRNNLKGSGNGLRNMKQRIEAVGGSFSIDPQALAGTTIIITVPFEQLNLHSRNTTIV